MERGSGGGGILRCVGEVELRGGAWVARWSGGVLEIEVEGKSRN